MRRPQNHKSAIRVRRSERRISRPISLHTAERTHVRRSNPQHPPLRRPVRFRATQILGKCRPQFARLARIPRARMRRLPQRSLRERPFRILPPPPKIFILQKSRLTERTQKIAFQIPRLQVASDPHQMRPQIQRAVLPVEIFQALHQRRRHDQRSVGKMERIANHQSGFVLERRRHKVESHSQARQHGTTSIQLKGPQCPRLSMSIAPAPNVGASNIRKVNTARVS